MNPPFKKDTLLFSDKQAHCIGWRFANKSDITVCLLFSGGAERENNEYYCNNQRHFDLCLKRLFNETDKFEMSHSSFELLVLCR